MTRFQKALRSQIKASRHCFIQVGFRRSEPGECHGADKVIEYAGNVIRKGRNQRKSYFPKGGLS